MSEISMTARGREAVDKLEEGLGRARTELRKADKSMVLFTREKPLVAVFAALAVGFVIGRVLSR